jgi:3-phenylpropionate/cinnamic acid dioxygenase small subunit
MPANGFLQRPLSLIYYEEHNQLEDRAGRREERLLCGAGGWAEKHSARGRNRVSR